MKRFRIWPFEVALNLFRTGIVDTLVMYVAAYWLMPWDVHPWSPVWMFKGLHIAQGMVKVAFVITIFFGLWSVVCWLWGYRLNGKDLTFSK